MKILLLLTLQIKKICITLFKFKNFKVIKNFKLLIFLNYFIIIFIKLRPHLTNIQQTFAEQLKYPENVRQTVCPNVC